MNIPLTVGYLGEEEQRAAVQAIQLNQLMGGGVILQEIEQQIQTIFVWHALLTTSCTYPRDGDVGAGDGAGRRGHSTKFHLCLDRELYRAARCHPNLRRYSAGNAQYQLRRCTLPITPRTRAIVPCIMPGSAALWMRSDRSATTTAWRSWKMRRKASMRAEGRYLGTIGDIGCYSFHSTKNIMCGAGGALLTNNCTLMEKIRIIQEKGTNQSRYCADWSTNIAWVALGSSYVQSDVLAAIFVQLAKRHAIREKRAAIWQRYYAALNPLAARHHHSTIMPAECDPNYHIFYFRVAREEVRNQLLHGLRQAGIGAAFHYVPLHSSPYGQSQGWDNRAFPSRNNVAGRSSACRSFPAHAGGRYMHHVIEQTLHLVERTTSTAHAPNAGASAEPGNPTRSCGVADMKFLPSVEQEFWWDVARQCDYATFFHTPLWREFALRTHPEYSDATIGVILPSGVRVVFPILRIQQYGPFQRLLSSFEHCYGGIIADGPVSPAEAAQIYRRAGDWRTLSLR